jgi:tRNA-splicing ligase RtcB (3'-phosphate/5'-hydroxy nucleic acid ligase)
VAEIKTENMSNSVVNNTPGHPRKVTPGVLSFASLIDQTTIDQAAETAQLPFIHPHVALMPDAHAGKGSAVGTVIPTEGAVIPAAVGVDIGCGMIAMRTCFTASDLTDREKHRPLAMLRESVESAIPMSKGGYNHSVDRFPFTAPRIELLEEKARELEVDLSHSNNWRLQLGTLGGGNHFIELCVDTDSRVWLFLHSGSRGVGNKIAQKHIGVAQKLCALRHVKLPNQDLAYLPQGTPEFARYLRDLRWAQRFALENRAEMMDRFRRVFASWMGLDPDDAAALEAERINAHHNYTVQEHHGGREVWLTRKGAIDAHEGVLGIITGSMGTRSYIVRGKGNPAGLCSAPHGAGRRYSRRKARELFTLDDLATAMTGIEYRHGEAWIDEIPGAYKDIDQVMADASELVEVVTTLRQVMNVKGE